MKRAFSILLVILPLIGAAQDDQILPGLAATSPALDVDRVQIKIDQFVAGLKPARQQSEITTLERIFNKTQKRFLQKYVSYSDFQDIFKNGNYDCLTATSLFTVVLDRFHFNYNVIETNYHIFILVQLSDRQVLLETTDRVGGFVTDQTDIEKRIGTYRKGITDETQQANAYRYSFDLYHVVNADQLPGLLYYNQAVKAYNANKYEQCADLLAKAHDIYDTPRISEFSLIFVKAVMTSNLDESVKQKIFRQFRPLVARRTSVFAAR